MTRYYQVGDRVFTVKPEHEPAGYVPGARKGNRWGVEGIVVQVSRGHGECYEVRHEDSSGWYEPEELRSGEVQTLSLWDHLAE